MANNAIQVLVNFEFEISSISANKKNFFFQNSNTTEHESSNHYGTNAFDYGRLLVEFA